MRGYKKGIIKRVFINYRGGGQRFLGGGDAPILSATPAEGVGGMGFVCLSFSTKSSDPPLPNNLWALPKSTSI